MSAWYNYIRAQAYQGNIDLGTEPVKMLLVDAGYTFDADHQFVADIVPATVELAGTGYSRVTLANAGVSQDDVNDRMVFDADDVTYGGFDAGTPAAAILYVEKTDDSDSPLFLHIDDGGFPVTPGGADFVVRWSDQGIAHH